MTEPALKPDALVMAVLALAEAHARSIWLVPGVDEQPEVTLTNWRVMRLTDREEPATSTVYLVGRLVPEWEGRVSSAVLYIDRETMRARTASGRLYELSGSSGFDDDGMYVWNRMLRGRKGLAAVTCDDITDDPAKWPQAEAWLMP